MRIMSDDGNNNGNKINEVLRMRIMYGTVGYGWGTSRYRRGWPSNLCGVQRGKELR